MYRYLLFSAIILAIACSSKSEEKEAIVAQVGSEVITAREFKLNYEFGYKKYHTGENPKQEYLNRMIDELILAQEGIKIGIHKQPNIQHAIQTISEERLIEEVFNKNVLEKIEVTDEEIRAEINKSAVSFQFRFIPAYSETQASTIRTIVIEKGFEEALSSLSNEMQQGELSLRDMNSPYMKAEDIDPELLNIIKDLEFNTISEPVKYKDQWFLFEVTDIRRQRLSDYDYESKSSTYRKVLYNKKAMQQGTAFVSSIMESKNLATDREIFNRLNGSLYRWYKDTPPYSDLLEKVKEGERVYQQDIQKLLPLTLITFEGKSWTVERFLEEFNPARYQLRPDSFDSFTTRFADIIALVVRDFYLLDLSNNQQLAKEASVQREIDSWKNKWTFQEYRTQFLDTLSFTDENVAEYFKKEGQKYGIDQNDIANFASLDDAMKRRVRKDFLSFRISQKANELRDKTEITIYHNVLDTIQVQNEDLSPGINVQLLKQNSNRPAFPVVDPNW